MRWRFIWLISSVMSAAAVADPSTLTLDEAVEIAVANAPEIAAQAERLAALQSLADRSGRLPDPELLIGIDNLPVNGRDAWSTTADFMTMRMVGLMQAFPQRSKRRLERERATIDVDGSNAELAAASLDIARETARAWIRRAALESAVSDLRLLRHDVAFGAEAARAGVAAGRVSTAEALAAQAAVVRLDNRIVELETGAHHAQVALGRWIGADAERPPAPPPDVDRLPGPAAALLAGIDRHGPILPYAARLEAARVDVAMARAEKRPEWSAALRFGKRGPDYSDMASLEFSIGLPLFARHRQDPLITAQSAELRRLEAERETTRRAHAAELHMNLAEWEQAGTRLRRYDRELLPLARERAAAALAGYRASGTAFQLVLDALEAEANIAVERALVADERGRAWAFLRYLEPRQLPQTGGVTP